MQIITSLIEPPPISELEMDPDFVTYWNGRAWIACYRFEEPDEFNGEAFGESTESRDMATADLALHFPREVRP